MEKEEQTFERGAATLATGNSIPASASCIDSNNPPNYPPKHTSEISSAQKMGSTVSLTCASMLLYRGPNCELSWMRRAPLTVMPVFGSAKGG